MASGDTGTAPFCGACGWDFVRVNTNNDIFCDSCGADLRRFLIIGLIPPLDLGAVPTDTDVTFSWTDNPEADSTEYQTQTDVDPWTDWAPAVSPIVLVGPPGTRFCIRVRSVLDGDPGPAAELCEHVDHVPATGADEVSGAEGTWTPAGATVPFEASLLVNGDVTITANPGTAWDEGSHMACQDASTCHWDGFTWAYGTNPPPPATGATAGAPGSFTPVPSTPPADFAAMAGIIADPLTLWTVGQSVQPADASDAYWDSAAWQVGVAPA